MAKVKFQLCFDTEDPEFARALEELKKHTRHMSRYVKDLILSDIDNVCDAGAYNSLSNMLCNDEIVIQRLTDQIIARLGNSQQSVSATNMQATEPQKIEIPARVETKSAQSVISQQIAAEVVPNAVPEATPNPEVMPKAVVDVVPDVSATEHKLDSDMMAGLDAWNM